MKIGSYEVCSLETGGFALDGGAMFGVIPKALWQRKIPADDENRIPLALRVLLLVGEGRVILVDTGLGDKFPPRQQAMYAIDPELSLAKALAAHDLSPADVSDVILTHLHFDHAGGATIRQGEGFAPAFANAVYHVQQRNWDWAHDPSEKDRASYLPENFACLAGSGQLRLHQAPAPAAFVPGKMAPTAPEIEILPGISAWLSDGHTIGQQLVRVHDPEQSLIYCADIIPTSAHLGLPWIMGYDLQPLLTMEEKRRLLQQAAEQGWIIVFEHDPYMPACTVRLGAKGVELAEPVTL